MDIPFIPSPISQDRNISQSHGKIADIEVLRGISILFVIWSHLNGTLLTWPMPWLEHITDYYFQFAPGVDLFFAISGFVIARTLIQSLQAARSRNDFVITVVAFWIRRCWRLLPSSWLWLGIILLAAAFFNKSRSFGLFYDNFESVAAALLTLANVHFAFAFAKFGLGASAPYWSLSLEEQFYFVLPLFVFAAGRRLTPALLAAAAIMFIMPENSSLFGFFRIQPILLGVLLALLAREPVYQMIEPAALASVRWARLCCLAGPLLLLAAMGPLGQRIAPYRYDVIALLAAGLVFVASYGRNYTLAPGRLKLLFVWLGSRSYGLYLIHTPVFCGTNELFYRLYPRGTVFDSRFTFTFLLVGLGATLALTELNYRFVEQPLRRRGVRIARNFEARTRAFNKALIEQGAKPLSVTSNT